MSNNILSPNEKTCQKRSKQIAKDVESYLARGGTITNFGSFGDSTNKNKAMEMLLDLGSAFAGAGRGGYGH